MTLSGGREKRVPCGPLRPRRRGIATTREARWLMNGTAHGLCDLTAVVRCDGEDEREESLGSILCSPVRGLRDVHQDLLTVVVVEMTLWGLGLRRAAHRATTTVKG
jgi:hypothetical protein